MIRRALRVLMVLFAGSLWSLALWVAPTVFYAQPDRHVAGILATRLFSLQTYLGLAVAVLALVLPGRAAFLGAYSAVALLVIDEWAVKPVMSMAHAGGSVAGLSFGAWHGVSALVYLSACIIMLVAMSRTA